MIVSNSRLLAGPDVAGRASPVDRRSGPAAVRPARQAARRRVTTTDGFGRLLVVSAHAADFVWRAAGYIAVDTRRSAEAHVVCLSYGEQGESPGAWKQPGMTLDRVKEIRRAEAQAAGRRARRRHALPGQGGLSAAGQPGPAAGLADLMRELQPGVILTHSKADPYNYDHPQAADLTLRARMVAQALGRPSAHPLLGAPPVFRFEPHQPEMCEFRPDVLVDITPVFDLQDSGHGRDGLPGAPGPLLRATWPSGAGCRRGATAARPSIRYAEAYQRVFPQVSGVLA